MHRLKENRKHGRQKEEGKAGSEKRQTEHGEEQPQHTSNEPCLSETPTPAPNHTYPLHLSLTRRYNTQYWVTGLISYSKTNMPGPLLASSQSRAGKLTMRYEGSATPTCHCSLQWSQDAFSSVCTQLQCNRPTVHCFFA